MARTSDTAMGTVQSQGGGHGGGAYLDGSQGNALAVPGPGFLTSADFQRHGPDLVLVGENGHQVVVTGYFANPHPPTLTAPNGGAIGPDLAAKLAGPVAPGQIAQGGGAGGLVAIGTVSKAAGTVEVTHPDGTKSVLHKGDVIYQGDMIATKADGDVAITFADSSALSLGHNGRMVIDELVYDPSNQSGHQAISVIKGAFALVSGQIAKTAPDAATVKTPVMTIGIRGTSVAGQADSEGEQNGVVLLQDPDGNVGQVLISTAGGSVVLNQLNMGTVVLSFAQPPSPPVFWSPDRISSTFSDVIANQPNPPTFSTQPAPSPTNDGQQGNNPGAVEPTNTGNSNPSGDTGPIQTVSTPPVTVVLPTPPTTVTLPQAPIVSPPLPQPPIVTVPPSTSAQPINNTPSGPSNTAPAVSGDTVGIILNDRGGTPLTGNLTATDAEGQTVSYSSPQQSTLGGTVAVDRQTGQWSYVAPVGVQTGTIDTFTVIATDSAGAATPVTVTVYVNDTLGNQAPTIQHLPQDYTSVPSGIWSGLDLTVSDIGGQYVVVTVTLESGGDGVLRYRNSAGEWVVTTGPVVLAGPISQVNAQLETLEYKGDGAAGTDYISVAVTDGGLSNSGGFSVQIQPQTNFIGDQGTDFADAANWDDNLPDASTNATIKSGTTAVQNVSTTSEVLRLTVSSQASLTLNGNLTAESVLTANTGSTLIIQNGATVNAQTMQFLGTVSINGATLSSLGGINISGGAVTFTTINQLNNTDLFLNSGSLTVAGSLYGTGNLVQYGGTSLFHAGSTTPDPFDQTIGQFTQIYGGTMTLDAKQGNLETVFAQGLTVGGSDDSGNVYTSPTLVITNSGTASRGVTLDVTGTLTNLGTITVAGNGTAVHHIAATEGIANGGTIAIGSPSALFQVNHSLDMDSHFVNNETGTLRIGNGATLSLTRDGTSSGLQNTGVIENAGTMVVESGVTFSAQSGTITNTGTITIQGSGQDVPSAVFNLNADTSFVSSGTSAALNNHGTLYASGSMTFQNGATLNNWGTINAGGEAETSNLSIVGNTVLNSGSRVQIDVIGGYHDTVAFSGGTLTNNATLTLHISADAVASASGTVITGVTDSFDQIKIEGNSDAIVATWREGTSQKIDLQSWADSASYTGTSQDETIAGATGHASTLDGGAGNDVLHGGDSAGDVLFGGSGNDVIMVSSSDFTSVDGGDGNDTLIYDASGNFDYADDPSKISNIEHVIIQGSDRGDSINGYPDQATIMAGDGGDTIYLHDTLAALAATIVGGAGSDTLVWEGGAIDLTETSGKITGIEIIDLSTGGDALMTLDAATVTALAGGQPLVVMGDTTDQLILSGTWAVAGTPISVTIDGNTVNCVRYSSGNAVVYVPTGTVSVTPVSITSSQMITSGDAVTTGPWNNGVPTQTTNATIASSVTGTIDNNSLSTRNLTIANSATLSVINAGTLAAFGAISVAEGGTLTQGNGTTALAQTHADIEGTVTLTSATFGSGVKTGTGAIAASNDVFVHDGGRISALNSSIEGDIHLYDNGTLQASGTLVAHGGIDIDASSHLTLTGVATVSAEQIVNLGTVTTGSTTTLTAGFTNAGLLEVGGNNAVGTLTIDGAVTLRDSSVIEMEFDNTGHDQLTFSGPTTVLNGTLRLDIDPDAAPANSDSTNSTSVVTLIDNTSGWFDTVELADGSRGNTMISVWNSGSSVQAHLYDTSANGNNWTYYAGNDYDETIFAATAPSVFNSISGGKGNDTIHDGAGQDTLWGGNGNDTLIYSAGADSIYGDAETPNPTDDGNDTVILRGVDLGNLFTTIDGGGGQDTLKLEIPGLSTFSIDGSTAATRIGHFEILDLTAQTVDLHVNASGVSSFTSGGNVMFINGGADDTVSFGDGADSWVHGSSPITQGGQSYEVYTNAQTGATVNVSSAITHVATTH